MGQVGVMMASPLVMRRVLVRRSDGSEVVYSKVDDGQPHVTKYDGDIVRSWLCGPSTFGKSTGCEAIDRRESCPCGRAAYTR